MVATMLSPKQIYCTWYTVLYRFAAEAWPPAINAMKAVAIVSIFQAAAVIAGSWAWGLFVGDGAELPRNKLTIQIAAIALYAVNYVYLVRHGVGSSFERGFDSIEQRKRRALVAITVLTWILIVAAVVTFGSMRRERLLGVAGARTEVQIR